MPTTSHISTLCAILFLASHALGEWVEIEQHHYKPHRKETINTEIIDLRETDYEKTTKNNRFYKNHTMEKQWNKGVVDRVTNVGNIRRVLTPSVKTAAVKVNSETSLNKEGKFNYHENTHMVQHYFPDQPIKSNSEEYLSKKDKVQEQNKIINNVKRISENAEVPPNNSHRITLKDVEKSDVTNKLSRNKINQAPAIKKYLIRDEEKEIIENDDDNHMNYQRINIGHGWTLRSTTEPSMWMDTSHRNEDHKDIHRNPNVSKEGNVIGDKQYSNILTTKPRSRITKIESTELNDAADNFDVKRGASNTPSEENKEYEESVVSASEDLSYSNKTKSMSGVWKLLKVVTDTIYKNTHRSFKSKVKYLERLQSTILTTIEDHIESIWPDDAEHRSRNARDARGHLEFPSSESALMSISFLTFAVFLIKLVLQVIHTYKNKTMMVTPTVVAAVGRAADILRSQT